MSRFGEERDVKPKVLLPGEARSAVYFDFEGTSTKPPSLLGLRYEGPNGPCFEHHITEAALAPCLGAEPLDTGDRIRYVRAQLARRGGDFSALTPTAKGKWTRTRRHNCDGLRALAEVVTG